MAAKKKAVKKPERIRMSESEIDKWAARYAKEHDLKPGKELADRFKQVAVTRLAALERNAKVKGTKPAKKAAKK